MGYSKTENYFKAPEKLFPNILDLILFFKTGDHFSTAIFTITWHKAN